jgi:hypothetical protein
MFHPHATSLFSIKNVNKKTPQKLGVGVPSSEA